MTDKTVADVADKAIDKIDSFVTKAADTATDVFQAASTVITDAVATYGPQAVDALLWVVRIDAAQQLISAALAMVGVIWGVVFVWTGFTRREWAQRISDASEGFLYLPICAAAVIAAFVAIASFRTVTNIWLYTAVIKPELYLVKQVVDVVKERAVPTKK